jgi:hypothetical protein
MVTRRDQSNHDPPPDPLAMQQEFETGVQKVLTMSKTELDARLEAAKQRKKRRPKRGG